MENTIMENLRPLGHSDIRISPVGLGCWQFSQGVGMAGRYWPAVSQEAVNRIVAASLAAGVNWFDTAELYGRGQSEVALSQALTAAGRKDGDVVIATKWWPALRTAASIRATIGERLRRLAPFSIDLYQVHQPFSLSSVKAQMDAMADLAAARQVRSVGVSNFSVSRMRAAHRALADRGLPLVANQMPYSLMNRKIESNGVLDAAKELGVTIIAYSPLAQGMLSGKFHREPHLLEAIRGPRRWRTGFRRGGVERSRALVMALQKIAQAHGATCSQVAFHWLLRFHGDAVVVIPGATSVAQAEENAGAARLPLSDDELNRIDELSRQFRYCNVSQLPTHY